jgi:hypothetical protein
MGDDREAHAAIDRVLDVLAGQEAQVWLRVGVAVSAIALGYIGEGIRPAFDRAISKETEWFADSFRAKAMRSKVLN